MHHALKFSPVQEDRVAHSGPRGGSSVTVKTLHYGSVIEDVCMMNYQHTGSQPGSSLFHFTQFQIQESMEAPQSRINQQTQQQQQKSVFLQK